MTKYVKICKTKYSSLQWKSLETNLSSKLIYQVTVKICTYI